MHDNRDIIFENELKSQLRGCDFNINVFRQVTSTNDLARQMAEKGADEGYIVVSNSQTAGRGKGRRVFYSPDESGLYMSIVLRPDIPPCEAYRITCTAAIAVCRALSPYSPQKIGIKWVNDVLIDEKKVCGILTESVLSENRDAICYAILGIGINLFEPKDGFAPEIKDIATSVFGKGSANLATKAKIAAGIISSFFEIYKNAENEDITREYRALSVLDNADITVLRGEEKNDATVLGIDDNLNLVVRYKNGSVLALSSGDVSIKKRI